MNKQNDPVMYFVVNQDLGMKAGKVAAQVGHAAIAAYLETPKNSPIYQEWRRSHCKIVLKGTTKVMHKLLETYPERCCPIYDEGRTQVEKGSFTVLGWQVMRQGDIAELDKLRLL